MVYSGFQTHPASSRTRVLTFWLPVGACELQHVEQIPLRQRCMYTFYERRARLYRCLLVVCEMKAIVIISRGVRLECSQAADWISASSTLVSSPQSEFVLIRTHKTLLVAGLRRITTCHWENRTVADTNKQEREGEKVQKQGHRFKTALIWGQDSDVLLHKLQPNFWHAYSGPECMHTHTHTQTW